MSTLISKPCAVLPDDAPFDPIAWATGAEGFDQGLTFRRLAAMDAWRRSYMEGYLDAMRVKAANS